MSRMTPRYLVPIDTADGTPVIEGEHGKYTLTALHNYVYLIGGAETVNLSVTMTGYTAALVVTSATIQDTDHPVRDVADISATAGEWITEDPPTPAFVGIDGTGWAAGATPGVVTAAGTGVGGARWNLSSDAATRSRIFVAVGAVGGIARVSAGGKLP